MDDLKFDIVMQRLGQLERAHRWWKALMTTTVMILGPVVLMGATVNKAAKVTDEIQAKRFVLVDDGGKIRAELAIKEKGMGLRLYDSAGTFRAALEVADFLPNTPVHLALADRTGEGRILLTTSGIYGEEPRLAIYGKNQNHLAAELGNSRGSPHLTLTGPDGNSQATLRFIGGPHLTLTGPDGNSQATLQVMGLRGVGMPDLRFYDSDGNVRTELSLAEKDGPSLMLYDKGRPVKSPDTTGKTPEESKRLRQKWEEEAEKEDRRRSRVTLFVGADGEPTLSLADKSGMPRAILGSISLETTKTGTVQKRPPSSLVLFDKDGKVIQALP